MTTEKKNAPFVGSVAGANKGDSGVGITLWRVTDKTQEDAPDVTGFVTEDGVKTFVSGWLIAGGKKDDREYGPFLTVRASVSTGEGYKTVMTGTLQGMNTYKGKPVDGRSRVIGTLVFEGGREVTAVGYANEGLANDPELTKALGFTGAIVARGAKTAAAQGDNSPAADSANEPDDGVADQAELQNERRAGRSARP